jgi:predicted esterase
MRSLPRALFSAAAFAPPLPLPLPLSASSTFIGSRGRSPVPPRRPRTASAAVRALLTGGSGGASSAPVPAPTPPEAEAIASAVDAAASSVDDTRLDADDDEVCFVDECTEVYRRPPPAIARLVDASVDPAVSLQPRSKEHLVLLERPNLPPIAEVAAEELRLAGFRINAATYAPSRADYFNGMHMQRIDDPERRRIPFSGLPACQRGRHQIGYVRWAPDGTRFAFCIYEPMRGLELWCAEVATRTARPVLPGVRLNAVCADPFTWSSDSRTVVAKFVIEDRAVPQRSPVPRGPIVQENLSSKPAPSRTFQDLLKDRHDVALFGHYTTCQLGRVDVLGGKLALLGLPAAFRRASPSPDGKYILVDAMNPPYEFMMPASRFPRTVEVWSMEKGAVVATVADIPLQDKIPIAFDGVGEGPRGIGWRADAAATLYWAEAQDGGDPNAEAEIRDCVYTLPAPFDAAPRRLASLAWRYNGLVWGSDSVALLTERRYKTRSARSYLIAPGPEPGMASTGGAGRPATVPITSEAGAASSTLASGGIHTSTSSVDHRVAQGPACARACDLSQGEAPRRMVIEIDNWENRYSDPGSVCTVRNDAGKVVLRLMYPENSPGKEKTAGGSQVGRPYFLMQGAGASDDGDRPFLSIFDTVTGEQSRIWHSCPPKFETIVTILAEDPATRMAKTVLIRQETPRDNPNFFIFNIDPDETLLSGRHVADAAAPYSSLASRIPATSGNRQLRAITAFPHPAPELADAQREIVSYTRADGVRLNGNLYLPPGYDAERDGPLPTFIWAYPREFKSAAYASQTRGSPYRFVRLARTPLYWLTAGYAILDGPLIPIISSDDGEGEPNDTFVPQLVSSAEAAVDFLVERGVSWRDRIAIGGHSYGAFMAVNLLAHAPGLFCCGIARSGAYNRTLTPFGFQSEERSLWTAPDVYSQMSPYMFADRVEAPLLLIHGEADNNAGTFPMQSERMYQALRGHGKIVRYVSLPSEGHGYRARESVMHALAEMTEWLDKYTKADGAKPPPPPRGMKGA